MTIVASVKKTENYANATELSAGLLLSPGNDSYGPYISCSVFKVRCEIWIDHQYSKTTDRYILAASWSDMTDRLPRLAEEMADLYKQKDAQCSAKIIAAEYLWESVELGDQLARLILESANAEDEGAPRDDPPDGWPDYEDSNG